MGQSDPVTDDQTVTVRVPITIRQRGGRKLVLAPDGRAGIAGSVCRRIDSAMIKAAFAPAENPSDRIRVGKPVLEKAPVIGRRFCFKEIAPFGLQFANRHRLEGRSCAKTGSVIPVSPIVRVRMTAPVGRTSSELSPEPGDFPLDFRAWSRISPAARISPALTNARGPRTNRF